MPRSMPPEKRDTVRRFVLAAGVPMRPHGGARTYSPILGG